MRFSPEVNALLRPFQQQLVREARDQRDRYTAALITVAQNPTLGYETQNRMVIAAGASIHEIDEFINALMAKQQPQSELGATDDVI